MPLPLLLMTMMMRQALVLVLALLCAAQLVRSQGDNEDDPTRATVVISRGADGVGITTDLIDLRPVCDFVGEIEIAHPSSVGVDDRHYETAMMMWEAAVLTVDHINVKRCGVHLSTGNYSLRFTTYSDDSFPDKIAAISQHMANNTNSQLWTASYSSSLTAPEAPIAEENQRVMLAAGSSRRSIYQNHRYSFGMFPAGADRFLQPFQATKDKGAKSVAYIVEEGLSACDGVPDYAQRFDMELMAGITIPATPSQSDMEQSVDALKELNPDLVISCIFQANSCNNWIQSMRQADWQPGAQVFSPCLGTTDQGELVGSDAQYMMSVALWNPNLPPVPDEISGWTPLEFSQRFQVASFRNATYHAPSQSAAISILIQAMERADSRLGTDVREILANQLNFYPTVYGNVSFDDNGQATIPNLLLQYETPSKLHVMYPQEMKSTDFELVYPLPTWTNRDCNVLSDCGPSGGLCDPHGYCTCPDNERLVTIGRGANATCKEIPNEDYSYISNWVLVVGYTLFGIQAFVSLFFIGWTFFHRHDNIIKVAQPEFLILIAVGGIIMSSAILPMTVETAYRNEQDPSTREPTGEENSEIGLVDASCMAWLWLAVLGFVIIYSALFAKILRIKKLLDAARTFRRTTITVKNVLSVMVALLLLEGIILLSWQLVDPLRWKREVTLSADDGFPLQSAGSCSSDKSVAFGVSLGALNIGILVYALYLSFITRKVPTELSEGMWITAAVIATFQILLLSGPILIIAKDEPDAKFFVHSMVVFLLGITTTSLVIGPKFYRFHFDKSGPRPSTRTLIASSLRSSEGRHSSGTRERNSAIHISGISNDDSDLFLQSVRNNHPNLEVLAEEEEGDEEAWTSKESHDESTIKLSHASNCRSRHESSSTESLVESPFPDDSDSFAPALGDSIRQPRAISDLTESMVSHEGSLSLSRELSGGTRRFVVDNADSGDAPGLPERKRSSSVSSFPNPNPQPENESSPSPLNTNIPTRTQSPKLDAKPTAGVRLEEPSPSSCNADKPRRHSSIPPVPNGIEEQSCDEPAMDQTTEETMSSSNPSEGEARPIDTTGELVEADEP